MQTLFVYYKLPQAQHADWVNRVRAFLDRVRMQFPDLDIGLMQRPEPNAEGLETWMEVYRHPNGVSAEMIHAIDALASEVPWPSKRASEVFIDLQA